MGSTDEPNRFQHTRVLGVEDVVANTGEGGVPAIVENAAGRVGKEEAKAGLLSLGSLRECQPRRRTLGSAAPVFLYFPGIFGTPEKALLKKLGHTNEDYSSLNRSNIIIILGVFKVYRKKISDLKNAYFELYFTIDIKMPYSMINALRYHTTVMLNFEPRGKLPEL